VLPIKKKGEGRGGVHLEKKKGKKSLTRKKRVSLDERKRKKTDTLAGKKKTRPGDEGRGEGEEEKNCRRYPRKKKKDPRSGGGKKQRYATRDYKEKKKKKKISICEGRKKRKARVIVPRPGRWAASSAEKEEKDALGSNKKKICPVPQPARKGVARTSQEKRGKRTQPLGWRRWRGRARGKKSFSGLATQKKEADEL